MRDPETWIAYMHGELDELDEALLWQSLIDTGLAWNMGPIHSCKAMGLILSQRCHQPGLPLAPHVALI